MAGDSAAITASTATSGSSVAHHPISPSTMTATAARSPQPEPPTPVRIESTKTHVKPMAPPKASMAPADAPSASWATAETVDMRLKISHDVRCGRVSPRRIPAMYGMTQPAVMAPAVSSARVRSSTGSPRSAGGHQTLPASPNDRQTAGVGVRSPRIPALELAAGLQRSRSAAKAAPVGRRGRRRWRRPRRSRKARWSPRRKVVGSTSRSSRRPWPAPAGPSSSSASTGWNRIWSKERSSHGTSGSSPGRCVEVPDRHGAADELVAARALHAVDAQVGAADADRVLRRPGAGRVVLRGDQAVPRVERGGHRRAEVDVAEAEHQVARRRRPCGARRRRESRPLMRRMNSRFDGHHGASSRTTSM